MYSSTPSTWRRLALPLLALFTTLATSKPLHPPHLAPRLFSPTFATNPGLTIDPSCPPDQAERLHQAISAIPDSVTAGIDAAGSPTTAPFSLFFLQQQSARVIRVLQNVAGLAAGRDGSPSIPVTCFDPLSRCVPDNSTGTAGSAPLKGSLAYTWPDPNSPYIVICPFYHTKFPATPDACARNARTTISLTDTLIHEMTHLPQVSGDGQYRVVDLAYGEPRTEELRNQSQASAGNDPTQDPTRNADSFMFMSRFAWLGGWGNGRPGQSCADNFRNIAPQRITEVGRLVGSGQVHPVTSGSLTG